MQTSILFTAFTVPKLNVDASSNARTLGAQWWDFSLQAAVPFGCRQVLQVPTVLRLKLPEMLSNGNQIGKVKWNPLVNGIKSAQWMSISMCQLKKKPWNPMAIPKHPIAPSASCGVNTWMCLQVRNCLVPSEINPSLSFLVWHPTYWVNCLCLVSCVAMFPIYSL